MIPATECFHGGKVSYNGNSFRKSLYTRGAILAFVLLPFIVGGCQYDAKPYHSPHQYNVEYIGVHCEPGDPLDRFQYEQGERIDARSVTLLGDSLLAVGTWQEDVFFIDVTDPEEPRIVSVFRTRGSSPGNLVVMNGNLYLSDSFGVVVADISEPTRPELIRQLYEDGEVLAAEDDRLYVTERGGPRGVRLGVQIWDTTNPISPTLAGVYIPPQSRVGENYQVFERRRLPTDGQLAAEDAAYHGSTAASWTQIFSCSPGTIWGADVENGLLYVSVSGAHCKRGEARFILRKGLWIVDVKDPTEPTAVGFLPMTEVSDIKVQGDYAYLATFTAFQIVDISDPEKPVLVGTHDAPDLAAVVEVEDNIAYVGDLSNLHIFDVTNPAQPVRIGLMPGFFVIDDIVSRDGIIYLAGVYQGAVDQAGTCQSTESIATDGVHFLRVIDLEAGSSE